MTRFRITYQEPKTEAIKTVEVEYADWKDEEETVEISAYTWAEDHAYMLADKGYFKIEEIGVSS